MASVTTAASVFELVAPKMVEDPKAVEAPKVDEAPCSPENKLESNPFKPP